MWAAAVTLLWHTEIPSNLRLPKVDAHQFFTSAQLASYWRYERFYYLTWAMSLFATIVALVVMTRRAPRWARSIGLGRVGTGVIIGMLTLTVLWFVHLPFNVADRWWERRHGLSRGSWVAWLTDPWLQLLGETVMALFLIVVLLALAGRFPRNWWIAAAPVLAALAFVTTLTGGWLTAAGTHPIHNASLRREVATLRQRVGAGGTPVRVDDVHSLTTQANAESVGLWPSHRVVLWDTLLDGRFRNGQIRFVVAHEFGHVVRGHLWKGVLWFILFAVPGLALLAWFTGRRGGLRDPGVLPYGILVLVLIQLVATPLENLASRRYESEADWFALTHTHDPAAGRGAFVELSRTSMAAPSPPTWAYILFENHPTIMQRIAMTEAYADRNGSAQQP